MKTSTKAALLSALVFPGAGQLYLRRYVAAAVLLLVATAALGLLLVPAIGAANAIAERVASGELALGPELLDEVRAATVRASAGSTPATVALVAAWLVGVAHAWFAGRAAGGRAAT